MAILSLTNPMTKWPNRRSGFRDALLCVLLGVGVGAVAFGIHYVERQRTQETYVQAEHNIRANSYLH